MGGVGEKVREGEGEWRGREGKEGSWGWEGEMVPPNIDQKSAPLA